MRWWQLISRSMQAFWRAHLAVALAAAVGTAVLVGALAVGDSMRASLKRAMGFRLGKTDLALVSPDRFVTEGLVDRLAETLSATTAPILYSRGILSNRDGSKRINQVHVYGVDERFYRFCAGDSPFADQGDDQVVVNETLARQLSVDANDSVLLRLEKPTYMSRDIALVPDSSRSIAARVTVAGIAGADQLGRFGLEANQAIAYNVFVPLKWLQGLTEREGLVNWIIVDEGESPVPVEQANAAVERCWLLADTGLDLQQLDKQGQLDLQSRRVFLDDALADVFPADQGVLTYFVNALRRGDEATPYSMVTAMTQENMLAVLPQGMTDDQIVITQWLAEDVNATLGDEIELSYFVLGGRRELIIEKKSFEVCRVLPMDHVGVDPNLMPGFPGLSDADNCRDWDPGIPIDLDQVRDKDESYWDTYHGSPKAFVTLQAGQGMWSSRYGRLTGVRFDAAQTTSETVTQTVLKGSDPAHLGLFFRPVRAINDAALQQGTDFGPLFLGLSMFLIAGAVILTGLLFVFSVESRRNQTGLLLAVGLSPKLVRGVYLAEGLAIAVLGAVPGLVLGWLYAKGLIVGLSGVWKGAIAHAPVVFAATPVSLVYGMVGGVVAALVGMAVTLRGQMRFQARELLSGDVQTGGSGRRRNRGLIPLVIGLLALVGTVIMLVPVAEDAGGNSQAASGAFFGAGFLVLMFGLCVASLKLTWFATRWNRPMVSTRGLAIRNMTRKHGRSLAVVGLLAFGAFITVSVSAFRQDPLADTQGRASGTGGFSWMAQSSLGILYDLNTDKGKEALGLDAEILAGTEFVRLRVQDGDEASCLNLNRAQTPRLLGVDPNQLARRGSFTFVKTVEPTEHPWSLLNRDLGPNEVPVIGDAPTVKWGLGRALGDTVDYVDGAGRSFKARFVGIIDGSVLQGNLLIAEKSFMERYPAEEGYRQLLIETPKQSHQVVEDHLADRLQDLGIVFTDTRERLARLNEIQNTYLAMFQALGGLGLLLGTIGLGVVVMRNMLDRRAEFAMLLAVGLSRRQLKELVFFEHWGLLLGGVWVGCCAAAVAMVPALRVASTQVPYGLLVTLILSIALSGALWVWLATHWVLQGPLLDGLRNE